MTVLQAFLCGLVYFLGSSSLVVGVGYYTLYRPLVSGFVVGLILGDPITGVIIGSTIQLLYLGVISAGGSLPSDQNLAGVLGTALAISGGLAPEAALAIAVPLGLLGTVIWQGKMSVNVIFAHWLDKLAEKGETKKVWIVKILLPQLLLFVMGGIPCALAAYYGASYITGFLDFLGANVLSILSAIGGMLPAIGIAMNMRAIFKGELKVFFFVGFLLTVYFNLSLLALSLLAVCAAVLYAYMKPNTDGGAVNE